MQWACEGVYLAQVGPEKLACAISEPRPTAHCDNPETSIQASHDLVDLAVILSPNRWMNSPGKYGTRLSEIG
nr:AIS_HP1_G0006450.mRNA.1.CDS.1 [Saccharomyces cerevisiae]